uniref:RING-type domain-containing protein n=1 Tax=Elaeophora elaphi TaxID=1147741 RepID=A0A0R3RTL5_9BILA
MAQQLQCLICLDALSLNESAAVHCGHTFHLHCILQWLERCKTCPVCRKKATARDLIRQLFFQLEEKNFNNDSSDPLEIHNELQNALDNLEKEKQATAKAKSEATVYLAANLLLNEKVANLESVSRLNMQQIEHLEGLVTKHLDTEKELQKYRKRLQATAFYKLLSSVKDEPVLEIDKYIANEGLEVKRFVALLRRQLKDAMKTIENQKEDLQENRKKISELQKKLSEHKNLNVALKKELASTYADPSQTVMNAALKEIIAFSPTQHSFSPFDGDDRKVFSAALIASTYKSTSGNSAQMEKIHETTPIRRKLEIPVFRDEAESLMGKASKNSSQTDIEDDIEEVFVPPIIRRCATTQSPGTLCRTLTVKRNRGIKNRESLKKRSSPVQHHKKKEARCSRYHDLKNDTIIID